MCFPGAGARFLSFTCMTRSLIPSVSASEIQARDGFELVEEGARVEKYCGRGCVRCYVRV